MKISKIALEIIGLLLNQGKECYLREIAKKTNNSTSSISRQLKALTSRNILTERKSGKELMYYLNLKNKVLLKICELIEAIRLEKFYNENPQMKIILQDFLEKVNDEDIVNITVFGSVAKENYTKESDVDILMITNKKGDFGKEIREIYAEYGKNISLINLTKKELKEKRAEHLIKEIIKNHIVLLGYEYFIQKVMLGE